MQEQINTEHSTRPIVRVWTDGSTCANPGLGGWAAYMQWGDKEITISGSTPWASNIRMELTAALRALQTLKCSSHVIIYTDSQYLMDGFKNILNRNKLLKSHYDLWGLILHLSQIHTVHLTKVKAHSGVVGNELADKAAKIAAREQAGDKYMWLSEKVLEKRRLSSMHNKDKKSWEY